MGRRGNPLLHGSSKPEEIATSHGFLAMTELFFWWRSGSATARKISARIPLQPQCSHWGSFPPGEAFTQASRPGAFYLL